MDEIGALTARASAAGVLREITQQASSDNLTESLLAGHDYRQVYSAKRRDTSARILRTRRGRRSAACAGYAARCYEEMPMKLNSRRYSQDKNGNVDVGHATLF